MELGDLCTHGLFADIGRHRNCIHKTIGFECSDHRPMMAQLHKELITRIMGKSLYIIDLIILAPCPHYSGLLPTCASVSDMYCLVTVVSPSRHAAFASNAIK